MPGSLAGAAASTVFMLAPSVHGPLAELAISNGLFPGLAGVVKTLAGELGPARIPVNGLLPFCYQLAWRSVPPVRRAGGTLSRNPGE